MGAVVRSLLILALLALTPAGAVAAQSGPAPVTAQDRVLGRVDAPVTIIEYASFACPACADWHQFVYPVFKQRLIDTGQVRYVFRNLPTAPPELSMPAAAVARCAAPERFFDTAEVLMRGQAQARRGGALDAWLAPAVAASGRTPAQIDACKADPATRAAIDRDIDSAHAAGADHTPTFFVNGREVRDRSLGGLEVAVREAASGG